jgi:hypothetical protein
LQQNVHNLEQRQLQLQRTIALHQEEASQEIESIDQVEEERKRQVPRLKTQISLFASTTGIKWDFSQEDLLSGSVVRTVWGKLLMEYVCRLEGAVSLTHTVFASLCLLFLFQAIPDQQGLKFFSMDPRDYSSMETANRLWSMMEGNA